MLFSILRSTEPYLDVYFSEASNLDLELQEAGFSTVRVAVQLMKYPWLSFIDFIRETGEK